MSFFLYFVIVLFFLNRYGGINTELKLADAVFSQDLHVNVFAIYVLQTFNDIVMFFKVSNIFVNVCIFKQLCH